MNRKAITSFIAIFFIAACFSGHALAQPKQQREKAQRLYAEGDQLYRQKNYDAAIDKYSEAISAMPNYPLAHFSKALAFYNLGKFDRATPEFDLALTQGYKPVEIYRYRWYSNYQTRNYDAALNDARQGAKLEPKNASFVLAAGDIYRAQKNFSDAITAYNRAAQVDPANTDVYYFIALAYQAQGDSKQQGTSALKAIEKGTRYRGESWALVGDAWLRSRDFDRAAQSYERALQEKPDQPDLYATLADIYRTLNRFDDAIATAKKGILRYPNDSALYTSLSWYYSLGDKPTEAIQAAKEGIRLQPSQAMGYTNLCRAYNDSKQYDLAIQACNSALKIAPADGETFLYLARAYDLKKQPKIATGYYTKAVDGLVEFTKANSDYSDGFYLLGNAYYAEGNRDAAIAAYLKCLSLAPRFAKARYNLGYMYVLAGNKPAAREQYTALSSIDASLADKLQQAINK
jgi:tetratricopeptide (TPR) repeat protein